MRVSTSHRPVLPLSVEKPKRIKASPRKNSRVTLYPVIRNFSEDGRRKALRELTLATVLHSRVTREETELEEEAERRERRERPPSSDGGARSAIRAGG